MRIDTAQRFANSKFMETWDKERFIDDVGQRISDLRAEARLMGKGAGKGDQQMG